MKLIKKTLIFATTFFSATLFYGTAIDVASAAMIDKLEQQKEELQQFESFLQEKLDQLKESTEQIIVERTQTTSPNPIKRFCQASPREIVKNPESIKHFHESTELLIKICLKRIEIYKIKFWLITNGIWTKKDAPSKQALLKAIELIATKTIEEKSLLELLYFNRSKKSLSLLEYFGKLEDAADQEMCRCKSLVSEFLENNPELEAFFKEYREHPQALSIKQFLGQLKNAQQPHKITNVFITHYKQDCPSKTVVIQDPQSEHYTQPKQLSESEQLCLKQAPTLLEIYQFTQMVAKTHLYKIQNSTTLESALNHARLCRFFIIILDAIEIISSLEPSDTQDLCFFVKQANSDEEFLSMTRQRAVLTKQTRTLHRQIFELLQSKSAELDAQFVGTESDLHLPCSMVSRSPINIEEACQEPESLLTGIFYTLEFMAKIGILELGNSKTKKQAENLWISIKTKIFIIKHLGILFCRNRPETKGLTLGVVKRAHAMEAEALRIMNSSHSLASEICLTDITSLVDQ